MGMKIKEVGGGSATGLADNFIGMLQSLMNGGGIGTAGSPNAAGSTGNIMSVLSDILAGGGGKAGSAISQLISKQQERDVNALRSRFGVGGGTAFGTPASNAEVQYRAEAAPQITNAITGLQLQALSPLIQSIYGLSQKGIAQRQLIQQKSGFGQALDVIGSVGKTAAQYAPLAFSSAPTTKSMGGSFANPDAAHDFQEQIAFGGGR